MPDESEYMGAGCPTELSISRIVQGDIRTLKTDVGEIKVFIGRLDERMKGLADGRAAQHAEHLLCRSSIDKEIDEARDERDTLSQRFETIITWFKALAVISSVLVLVLGVLNVLQFAGVIS